MTMFVCRVCLTFEDNLFPISEYDTAFHLITSLVVERDALMCPTCIRKLNEAYTFREQALKADKTLRQLKAEFEQQQIKEEPIDELEIDLKTLLDTKDCPSIASGSRDDPIEPEEAEAEIEFALISTERVNRQEATGSRLRRRGYNRLRAFEIKNCPYCFYYNKDKRLLLCHIQNHIRENGGLECDHCHRKFKHKRAVKEHLLRAYADPDNFRPHKSKLECRHCGLVALNRPELKQHMDSEHSGMENLFKCHICAKIFPKQANLQQHIKLHDKSNQYQCSQCDKSFNCMTYLRMHEHRHAIGKPYVCSVCGKSFSQKANLTEHESIHTTEKRYGCDHCGNFFKTTRLLKSHLMTHKDEYRHTCSYCGMNFKRKSNLREHLLSHSEKRDFSCSLCGTVFKAKASLRRHLKKHMDQQPQLGDLKTILSESFGYQTQSFDFASSKVQIVSGSHDDEEFLGS